MIAYIFYNEIANLGESTFWSFWRCVTRESHFGRFEIPRFNPRIGPKFKTDETQ